jgi:hypothetical protein
MTAEEKTVLDSFLHKAEGYLGSGFAGVRAAFAFKDDPQPEAEVLENAAESPLPLAYLVDEDDSPHYAEGSLPVMVVCASLTEEETQLLGRMLASIGLFQDSNCHILDITEDGPALEIQIQKLNPQVILCAGKEASNSVATLITGSPPPVLKTFHPAELLRDSALKRPAFDDMKRLLATLAEIDDDYRNEVTELIKKYAAADPDFASRIAGQFQELA